MKIEEDEKMFCFILSHRFLALFYALAVLALAGCKDHSANPPENLVLSGYVKEVRKVRNIRKPIYDLDTVAVTGVSITLDSTSKTTDENGFFSFQNLVPNEFHIKIEGMHYITFDTNIVLQRDEAVHFELSPVMKNYYPLAIGNKWVYDFVYYSSGPAGNSKIRQEGEMVWDIIGAHSSMQKTKYDILCRFTGTYLHTYFYFPDTLKFEKIENEKLLILITQDEGRLFFAIGQSQPENSLLRIVIGQLSSFTENTILENSYPAYSGEILSLPWLTGGSTDARSLLLTKGKGLSLFSYRSGGHNVTGYKISLLSEEIKK